MLFAFSSVAAGSVELVTDDTPQTVFAGQAVAIKALFRNSTDEPVEMEITTRLFQASAATMMPVGDERRWKRLQVLPKQTVVETVTLTIPEINVPTRFQVRWGDVGKTDVFVYPKGLLKGLKTLAGEQPLVVFDPDNKLKPLLKQDGVEFAEFDAETPDSRLAILCSSTSSLPQTVLSRIKKGMAAVWFRPQKVTVAYAVRVNAGVVIMAPLTSVSALAESPLAQVNLLRFAELALQPETLQLPSEH